jgi:acetyl-CoA synthetase
VTDFDHAHDQVFPVRSDFASTAHVNEAGYREAYDQAASNPEAFWAKEAQRLAWIKAPTKIKNTSFTGDVSIKWFEDGVLNASVSCLDRHLAERGDQTAII